MARQLIQASILYSFVIEARDSRLRLERSAAAKQIDIGCGKHCDYYERADVPHVINYARRCKTMQRLNCHSAEY